MRNTTLIYIEKDGKYLMMHRIKKENDENRDKWIGVGGHFEENESPEDCAVREIYEETGLVCKKTDLNFRAVVTFVSDKWGCEYMHLFTVDRFEGSVKECNEGCLEWVDKDKICNLPIWEGDKIFLSLISKPSPFFSLKLTYAGDYLTEAILNGDLCKTNKII